MQRKQNSAHSKLEIINKTRKFINTHQTTWRHSKSRHIQKRHNDSRRQDPDVRLQSPYNCIATNAYAIAGSHEMPERADKTAHRNSSYPRPGYDTVSERIHPNSNA